MNYAETKPISYSRQVLPIQSEYPSDRLEHNATIVLIPMMFNGCEMKVGVLFFILSHTHPFRRGADFVSHCYGDYG